MPDGRDLASDPVGEYLLGGVVAQDDGDAGAGYPSQKCLSRRLS